MQECQDLSSKMHYSVILKTIVYASIVFIECQWFVQINKAPSI